MAGTLKLNAQSTTVQATRQSSDLRVRRDNGNVSISGTLHQSAAPCAQYTSLRRSAADRCGSISSFEALQVCLRQHQGQACLDAFPNDAAKRSECIGCVSQASVDPRLRPAQAGSELHATNAPAPAPAPTCGCAKTGSRAALLITATLLIAVFAVLLYCACRHSGSR